MLSRIKTRELQSQFADIGAQDYPHGSCDAKLQIKNEMINHILIGEGAILSFCFISIVLYKIYYGRAIDKADDLESAKTVLSTLERYL